MWWSPGLLCGALFVVAVYTDTGRADQLWCWMVAVGIAILVDAALGIKQVKRPNPRTRTVYEQDPEG